MNPDHVQTRMFDLPETEQVSVTLTQVRGIALEPDMGAELMKSPRLGQDKLVRFAGVARIDAFGWRGGTLTYSAVVQDAVFQVLELHAIDTETGQ